jgi:hypothetical protein
MIHWLSWGGFTIGIAVLSDSFWRSIGVGVLDRIKIVEGGSSRDFIGSPWGLPTSQ